MATEKIGIMVVDDEDGIRKYISKLLTKKGYDVIASPDAKDALEKLRLGSEVSLVILDILMPDMDGLEALGEIKKLSKDLPVVMLSALGQTKTIVKAMKAGATDYLVKPFEEEELELAVSKALEKKRLLAEISSLKKRLRADEQKGEFVFVSPKMQRIKDSIEQVADTDVSILIQGESGTGKELVARSLHYSSSRADKPFVKVNCAALPTELLESELFGYERGAFTGAYRAKAGKFELANNGTIFLDEISEIALPIQAKLLQVLQDAVFARLGGKQDVHVNVRIITASNKDLKKEVEEGKFREDIYYRLNVVNIYVPSLKERIEDIPLLFEYFLDIYNEKYGKMIHVDKDEIYPLLFDYSWPGNVRELKNLVKRLVILEGMNDFKRYLIESDSIGHKGHQGRRYQGRPRDNTPDGMGVIPLKKIAKDASMKAEEKMILKALQGTNWNKKKAAQILQISYKALLYKIKECGIEG
ncbi:MAG: sigma-54-dependent Fis family transcriptional regulator [Deltaproteobacteria bacterium]|nr:sigma-54-dependent Fis family transcriptional regulator [Deltaproteobacteria bacterium]